MKAEASSSTGQTHVNLYYFLYVFCALLTACIRSYALLTFDE